MWRDMAYPWLSGNRPAEETQGPGEGTGLSHATFVNAAETMCSAGGSNEQATRSQAKVSRTL
jgi:hypothetical protein